MADLYKGIAGSPITYLTSDITANQTTISIDDDSALPDAPNICTIGYGEHLETIKYETKSNGVLQNVTRGIEGTPRAWQAGTEVARFFTAYDHNAIIDDFIAHKADFASLLEGGEVLTATLQNGWTGTLQYSKDDLGYLWLRGAITSGVITNGTVISTLPEGFRPSRITPILAYRSDGSGGYGGVMGLFVGTSGAIAVRDLYDKMTTNSSYEINAIIKL